MGNMAMAGGGVRTKAAETIMPLSGWPSKRWSKQRPDAQADPRNDPTTGNSQH